VRLKAPVILYNRDKIKTLLPGNRLLGEHPILGVIDRTKSVDIGIQTEVITPLPDFEKIRSVTFEECCMGRAEYLISLNRTIRLFWSGGIDSSVALIALLKAGIKPEQLEIVMSPKTIMESPKMYVDYVMGKLKTIIVARDEKEFYDFYSLRATDTVVLNKEDGVRGYIDPNAVNVNGDNGDLIFGGVLLSSKGFINHPERLGENPEKHIDPEYYRLLKPVMQKAPFPIRTLFEWLWWHDFALCWQDMAVRFADRMPHMCGVHEYLFAFFNTPAFQKWSVDNISSVMPESRFAHKRRSKEFIYSFTHDEDYLVNKAKAGSLRPLSSDAYIAYLIDGTRVTEENIKDYLIEV